MMNNLLFTALAATRKSAFFCTCFLGSSSHKETQRGWADTCTLYGLHYRRRIQSIQSPDFLLMGSKHPAFCYRGETMSLSSKVVNKCVSYCRVNTTSSKAVHNTNILETIFWNKGQSVSLLAMGVEMRDPWRTVSQTAFAKVISDILIFILTCTFACLSNLISYSLRLHCHFTHSGLITPFSLGFLLTPLTFYSFFLHLSNMFWALCMLQVVL